MRKLFLLAILVVSAFSGTASATDHIYCNDNYEPPIGTCHANHGHPNGH